MAGVHCENFPNCMALGENATVPTCHAADCPGALRKKFVEGLAHAMTHVPRPETPEEEEIENMRAYLWAAGICAGDAAFAAAQLYRQGFRITRHHED